MGTISITSRIDVRHIDDNSKVVLPYATYIKADVEEKLYFWFGRPVCILKMPDAVYAAINYEQAGVSSALLMAESMSPVNRTNTNPNNNSPPNEGTPENPPDGSSAVSDSAGNIDQAKTNQLATNSQMAADAHAINRMGFQAAAVIPAVAAIPMRSNIRPYGPYASNNFLQGNGGVTVEVNSDVAPWVYGSIGTMNTVAQALANSYQIGLHRAENGSFTKPGFPAFSSMAQAISQGGAILSDLNFSYGSNGITTTYKFQTYTPKKGTLFNQSIDKLKNIVTARTEQLRFLRNEAIYRNKVGFKNSSMGRMFRASSMMYGGPRNRNSLGRVLVGQNGLWNKLPDGSTSSRSIVGVSELSKTVAETSQAYQSKAFSSLDFFFAPVSKSGDGNLPSYSVFNIPSDASSDGISTSGNTIGAHPPVSSVYNEDEPYADKIKLDQYNLSINRKYLDPLTFPDMPHHHEGEKLRSGNTFDIVGRGDRLPARGLLASVYNMNDPLKYASKFNQQGQFDPAAWGKEPDYRFMALRGPLVIQQWGYDTDGKPIPNSSDVEYNCFKGNFTRESLSDKFMNDWVSKPHTWPVGPIDLRFDRNRGVWTAPPPYRIIAAELMEDLESGKSAAAKILQDQAQKLYDKEGTPIDKPTIKIRDRINCPIAKGTKVYCYYDTYFAEYIAFTSSDNSPIIITGEAVSTFYPQDKSADVKIIVNAKIGDKSISPEFKGYLSSKSSSIEGTIDCYNVKRCGALAGDLVTIQRVSLQGEDTTESLGKQEAYVYIIIHTGENINKD